MNIPFISHKASSWEQWLETLIITFGLLALGYYVQPDDPLFVNSEFPWLWFGPMLIALRYGIPAGMVSAGIISLFFLLIINKGDTGADFPTSFMLGGLLLTLICGQFCTVWTQRLRRSDQLSSHASERFEQLSRAYFMVRLSHDRLEQNLISRPVTLRDAMQDLRTLLAQNTGQLDEKTTSTLLSILVHYCSLESAAIHTADDYGNLLPNPVATCGRGAPLTPDDLLLRSAIESGNTAYQSANKLSSSDASDYLVAAPLRTSSGLLRGMLLVTEMPFLALHRETLQIMGVLLAYAADQAGSAEEARGILGEMPECPIIFAAELVKMVMLRRNLEVSSALVAVNILPDVRLEELCSILERQQRGLDHVWRRDLPWGVQFVTLMPFSAAASIEGYQTRLNRMLHRQFGKKIGQGGISLKSTMLTSADPLQQMTALLMEEK